MKNSHYITFKRLLAVLPAAALLVTGFAGSMLQTQQAWSDDRQLLGTASEKPYVMFILDISSSMRRRTGEEHGAWLPLGNDDPEGKIYQAKKAIYQVITEVGDNALYGFATYDIAAEQYWDKAHVYTLQSNPSWFASEPDFQGGSATPPWTGPGTSNVAYPRVGHPLVFGDDRFSDAATPEGGNNDQDGSCSSPENLDIQDPLLGGALPRSENKEFWTDVHSLGALWAHPNLGLVGEHDTIQWFQYKGEKYKMTWKALSGGRKLGDVPLEVKVDFQRLNNGNCSSPAFDDIALDETLTLVPLYPTDLDGDALPGPPTGITNIRYTRGFADRYNYRYDHSCDDGEEWMDPNWDSTGDANTYDAIQDPLNRDPVGEALGLGRGVFDRGDMIPLDWTNPGYSVGNRQEILRRLAPSILLGQPPDFRTSPYFKDNEDQVAGLIPLKDEFVDYPPIGTGGGTPIAGSLYKFRAWFDHWVEIAKDDDPGWDCRSGINVIMITDGAEECEDDYPGSYGDFCEGALSVCPGTQQTAPGVQAEILLDGVYPGSHPLAGEKREVKTWVIGFSFGTDIESSLNDMAQKGGTCSDRNGDTVVDPDTECAFFPNTQDSLKNDLLSIFSEIRAEPRSFVPAATPPRSYNLDPKIVLTNFVPVPGESTWDGHMNAFTAPLPLTIDGRPNTGRVCNGTTITESCFLWDAGEELESQTPTTAEVMLEPPTLKLGPGDNERRVFFSMEQDLLTPDAIPQPRRLFEWTGSTTEAEWDDLVDGFGFGGGVSFCGDATCDPGENTCNCAADCGAPPSDEFGMCTDAYDNDCDGNADCGDGDCATDPACAFCGDSICGAGEDKCNCAVDCGGPPGSEAGLCSDLLDNDCDTQLDCADPDCTGDPACVVCGDSFCDPGEDSCSCAADCGPPPGSEVGLCADTVDNDCDGQMDCFDTDCAADPACTSGCSGSGALEIQITDGNNDVEENDDSGWFNIPSGDLDFDQTYDVGLRFPGVTVPAGATIDSAVLDLRADESDSAYAVIVWDGEAVADSPPFQPINNNLLSRTFTSASVIWDPVPTWWAGTRYITPDLSPIVQEIIDLPGWAEGNAIMFHGDTPTGTRVAEPYEGGASRAPILRISWSCPAPKAAPAARAPAPPSATTAEEDRAKNIIRQTLRLKTAFLPDPDTGTDIEIQYILGDIFHSDPTVVGVPENGRYYASDLFSTSAFDCTDNPGYRCYFEKHQYRRQVLVGGANDGEIHAFDLATYEYDADPAVDGEFNTGTGKELFAYIPRDVLPNLVQQAEGNEHDWDVDNPARVADVFIDPAHDGTPTVDDREWRTVAIGGLRRGGRVVWALDMTQPDTLDGNGVGQPGAGGYVPSCWNSPATPDVDGTGGDPCGPVAYGSALWEFTDTWDEDPPPPTPTSGTGQPDLGDTWSVVNTGLLRVLVDDGAGGTEEAIKFVAVFGGGLDESKLGRSGNWLYMVDIETGKTIYKRRLSSSAASEPAAVDTDGNGFLDTIYIGTIDGYLYKADIGTPKELVNTTVNDYSEGSPPPTVRTVDRVIDAAWEPFAIFDTGGRTIYYPPSVIFVGKLGLYSVAFGTGDREDILAAPGQVPRFYNIVDDNFAAGDPSLPLAENDLKTIPYNTTVKETVDLLVDPPAGKELGWVLTLGAKDKVVTKSLAFGGIITFTTFSPEFTDPSGCGGTGTGKIFIIDSTNANPIHEEDGDETRYFSVDDFLTSPFVEPGSAPGDDDDDDDGLNNPCGGMLSLTQRLQSLFPPSCKFSNRTQNVMSQRSDTGVECIAPVPVCVDGRNWKEY